MEKSRSCLNTHGSRRAASSSEACDSWGALCNVLNGILKSSCMATSFIALCPTPVWKRSWPGAGGEEASLPLGWRGCCSRSRRAVSYGPELLLLEAALPVILPRAHQGDIWGWSASLRTAGETGELCVKGSGSCPPVNMLQMRLGLCSCLRGRGTVDCSQRFQSSRKTTRHGGERLYLKQSACDLP